MNKSQSATINLIECPRDAMQGWKPFIPTKQKIEYLNALLKVGFHTIDFGSFVSHTVIPQMSDTSEVLKGLEINSEVGTKLLAIVANIRGAEAAMEFEQIKYLGFPFSISPSFQLRNTNSTMEQSLQTVSSIQSLCHQSNKELIVYMSMGFGNPYRDEYSESILIKWTEEILNRGIRIISLADTVGLASVNQIRFALRALIPSYKDTLFGVHLHANSINWKQKFHAALDEGCVRFDGALKGIGGCPMAQDELVGNMDSILMIEYLKEKRGGSISINEEALNESIRIANQIFI